MSSDRHPSPVHHRRKSAGTSTTKAVQEQPALTRKKGSMLAPTGHLRLVMDVKSRRRLGATFYSSDMSVNSV